MKRHGFTIVEISAALAVLAVCALLFAQLATLIASERLRERTQQMAVDQLQNIMERFAAADFDSGAFDRGAAESLIERALPEGTTVFDTKTLDTDTIIFTVTVSWSDGEKRSRREISMFRLLTPEEQ